MKLTKFIAASAALAMAASFAMADGHGGPNVFAVGGKPDDPFWSRVKLGAEHAGLVAEAPDEYGAYPVHPTSPAPPVK